MEVFILSRGNGVEGYEIEGLYSTEEKARKEAARRFKCEGEYWKIEKHEIDGDFQWVDFLDDPEDEED